MNKKYIKVSLMINILIIVFTIFSTIIMFTGFKFMSGEHLLETSKIGMLKFFTVDSNIFMGLVSLIFCTDEVKLLQGKINEIPKRYYVLKLTSTVGVTLTFLTVFGYLGFIMDGVVVELLKNSNLFFHLITPLLSIITFIFFEKTDKLNFKYTIFGISPTIIYALFYLINVLIHIENGRVSPVYDWYYFVQGGIINAVIVLPLMLTISYLISLLLWKFNRKIFS